MGCSLHPDKHVVIVCVPDFASGITTHVATSPSTPGLALSTRYHGIEIHGNIGQTTFETWGRSVIKVFLSYSRSDVAARERFKTLMKPLERDALIECWIDERIEPGEGWREEIEQGLADAGVAVLLVSDEFHGSDFIAKMELPVILAKWAGKQIEIIPVFLRQCSDPAYPYQHNFNEREKKLGSLQGIGAPDKPLNGQPEPERDGQWTRLYERIETLAKQASRRPAPPSRRPPGGPAATGGHEREPAGLLARLATGDGQLTRDYRSDRLRHHTPAAAWSDWRDRLAPLWDWTANPTQGELQARARQWSELLFELLFGTETEQALLFQALNGNRPGADKPSYRPYQVSIETEHPDILRLPWQLCDWRDALRNRRGGWCFQTSGGGSLVSHTVDLPLRAFLVAADQGVRKTEILEDLARQIRDEQGLPETGQERLLPRLHLGEPGIDTRLGDRELDILVYHGPLVSMDVQPDLRTLAATLQRSARQQPFHIVCLLLTDGAQRPGRPTPVDLIAPHAGFLSVEYLSDTGGSGGSPCTLQWMAHWLREHRAPIRAWTEVLSPVVRGSAQAARVMLHGPPAHWLFTEPATDLKEALWKIFDRTSLKATLQAELDNICRPRASLRVLALCPFGTRGDHASRFSEQLRHHLEKTLPDLPLIAVEDIGLPSERNRLTGELDAHLGHRLAGYTGTQALHEQLAGLVPATARQGGRKPVIWLDWGAFGATAGLLAPLTLGQIRVWLDYCATALVRHCPADTVLVSVLSMETASLPRLTDFFEQVANESCVYGSHFRLHEPTPLERIKPAHILRLFSEHPGLIVERQQLRQDVARDIAARSQGLFEKAVRLLERGIGIGWENLLKESPRAAHETPHDDEIA